MGLGGVAAVSLGAAFWDELFGGAESAPLRTRARLRAAARRPTRTASGCPSGFRSRVVARGGNRWRAPAIAGTWPPTGWRLPARRRRLRARVQLGGLSGRRVGAALRPRRRGDRRLPHPPRHHPELLRRGHPVGHLAVLRGGRGRAGLGVRPVGPAQAVPHPAMGVFKHEAAAVDEAARRVYLTEDLIDGGLYRYTPERWPDLSAGQLEIARVERGGGVEWVEVPDPLARRERTRRQVPGSTRVRARRGHLARRQHALRGHHGRPPRARLRHPPRAHRRHLRRAGLAQRPAAASRPADRLARGEVFVCEDMATDEIDMGVITPDRKVSKFLSVTGPQHERSELTGVTFDPSGRRMFFASQRAFPKSDLNRVPGRSTRSRGPSEARGRLITRLRLPSWKPPPPFACSTTTSEGVGRRASGAEALDVTQPGVG